MRGSTELGEQMGGRKYSELMNRFYAIATGVLIKRDALIDNLVGDEVIGLFLPLFSGRAHALLAVEAANDLLRVTGHSEAGGPWLSIGIGVNTGLAYVGTVGGSEGTFSGITALGDCVNVTSRLAATAGPGEALVSEAAYHASGLSPADHEQRRLRLKGKAEPVNVRVLKLLPRDPQGGLAG